MADTPPTPGGQPTDSPHPSPGEVVPHAERAPTVDPEQQPASPEQQFHQFQQFQDFLRYNKAQQQSADTGILTPDRPVAQPPVQPSVMPRWVKRLLGKILSILITIILLVIAGKFAYNYFFPSSGDSTQSLIESGGGKYHTNNILSSSPHGAVRSVYDAIAKTNPDPASQAAKTCVPMREDIQQKFAEDLGFPDCRAAALGLHKEVTDLRLYQESIPATVSGTPTETTMVISSCAFNVQGGRPLGSFTVSKIEMDQWLIVGHENEPTPCPSPQTTAQNPFPTFGE